MRDISRFQRLQVQRCRTRALGATQPGLVGSTFPRCSGKSAQIIATYTQLGGFTRKAKTSWKRTSPPNFRKTNLRCDAGLFDNSSLSLFFRSAQDAVLGQHVFTELRRLAPVAAVANGDGWNG